ncbi:MAG: glycosyltransferase, partial [Salibacteraceae bacterium]
MPPIFELLILLAVKVVNHAFFGVLNWGLGHASRSTPIIKYLIDNGIKVTIGSDGGALDLLKHEFPNCDFLELSSYNIEYSRSQWALPFTLLCQIPKLITVIKQENKLLKTELKNTPYDLIISDNRYGIRDNKIPSVIISHQLKLRTPTIANWVNHFLEKRLSKFDRIWVPDTNSELSGELSNSNLPAEQIGWLSAIQQKRNSKDIDVLVVLSGPEPQRTILENKLNELVPTELNSMIVR